MNALTQLNSIRLNSGANISGVGNIGGLNPTKQSENSKGVGEEFSSLLKKSITELDDIQKRGEAAMTDIATGEVKDLHQAALAITKAESSMKFMLEVRNKAISAYKEISKTPV